MNLLKLGLATSVACAVFSACGDDASSAGAETGDVLSSAVELSSAVPESSAAPESSSSAIPESSDGISSSISDAASSSSSFGTPPTLRKGSLFRWEGISYLVETGLDNGTETSGYWFANHSRDSYIEWPVATDERPGFSCDDFLDPIIDECSGVCGTFKLDASDESKPFVAVGFNVAGVESDACTGEVDVADASAWGGLCISYTADVDAMLELSMGEARDSALAGFDLPYVSLPKSEIANEVCVPWARFKQDGWGTGKITGDEIAANLASVRFKIQAADSTVGDFNIMSIGSYN
ncbi:MAG: hypothetical protein IKX42_07180 [Fibrobacter sp.]|nr:hypothetical protein [Fibrobacter sp.]